MKLSARGLPGLGLGILVSLAVPGAARPAAEVVLYAAPAPPKTPSAPTIRLTGAMPLPPPAPQPKETLPAPRPKHHPLFGAVPELAVEALVQQVLARNPSLAQMEAAWQAAQARYPQVTSLDDPMFAGTIGPGTIAPDDAGIHFAYRLEFSQKYPWPGKLKLRGQNAQAEARAAYQDIEDMRLQLVESARTAFYDYYLVGRALTVNDENLRLLNKFLRSAESRYENNLVPLQDVEQARVEIGREQHRRLTLERMQEVAVARINTLLNLPPVVSLPPAPRTVQVQDRLPGAEALRAYALARRPDLLALAHHIEAEQASLGLAFKEFYPDLEPFVMYDRFMGNNEASKDLATMVGVRLNLPVRKAKRYAAVAEAQARLNGRRAELARLTNQVNFEVQQAYAQVRESNRTVRLYQQTVLPAAKKNVDAAESAYETGKIPFLSMVQAQRDRVMLLDRYYEAVADYYRRRATLERVSGGPLETASAARNAP